MERLLKVRLFHRDTRRVVLTPAGAQLLPVAQRILDQFDQFLQLALTAPSTQLRAVSFGMPPWLHPDLRTALSDLEELYSKKFAFKKWPRGSAEIAASIRRGEIAFGFVRSPFNSMDLKSSEVCREKMGAVLSRSRYGSRISISASELLDLNYVTARRGDDTEYRFQVERELESAGILKRIEVHPGDYVGASDVISAGEGFAIAPLASVSGARTFNAADNVCLPVSDLDFTLVTNLVWRTDLGANNADIQEVIETMMSLFRGVPHQHTDSALA